MQVLCCAELNDFEWLWSNAMPTSKPHMSLKCSLTLCALQASKMTYFYPKSQNFFLLIRRRVPTCISLKLFKNHIHKFWRGYASIHKHNICQMCILYTFSINVNKKNKHYVNQLYVKLYGLFSNKVLLVGWDIWSCILYICYSNRNFVS